MITDLFKCIRNQDETNTVVFKHISDGLIDSDNYKLNIVHFNIRSIKKNFEELLIYLESVITNIDVVVLSETWNIESVNQFNIPDYETFYNESEYNQNDGLVVLIRKTLAANVSTIHLSETNLISINLIVNNIDIGILASYRPPSIDVQLYINELYDLLKNNKKNKIDIFLGDININIQNVGDNNVNNYLNVLSELGYISYINKTTRATENSSTIIDHIFVNRNTKNYDFSVNIKPMIFETNLSDHYTTCLSVEFDQIKTNKPRLENTSYSKINYTKVKHFLEGENWEEVINSNNIQESYNIFINKIKSFINQSSTTINIKNNKIKKIKPWITIGLINSIRQRDSMKKQLIKNYTIEKKTEYTRYRNSLTNLLRKTRNDYYSKELTDAKGNYKKIWQTINSATASNTKSGRSAINIKFNDENGKQIYNNETKANHINSYFINIGEKMAGKIDKSTENQAFIFEDENIHPNLFLQPTTENEIISIISNLKNKSAPGPDGISSELIKCVHQHIVIPLVHLINLSFKTGDLPYQWKESVVTPVYKSGDTTNVCNYRPISVINNFAKIFEQCLKNRLIDFFDKFDVITDRQFGFRKNKSTEHAVLDLLYETISNLDSNKKCLAVFLDLAKAFDTVSHHILLERLEHVGVRGLALNIFKNYLKNRTQKVKIDNFLSESQTITMGVPQGTVLGPILFLVYINSMANLKNFEGHLTSYADDTAMVFVADSWENVYSKAESSLYIAYQYLNISLLSLNVDKSKFLTFTLSADDQPFKELLTIHKKNCPQENCNCPQITKANKVKYLGIILDQHLRWNDHIEYITKKIRILIHKFYLLRGILNRKNLLMVYDSLVASITGYCVIVWGGLFKNALKNLQVTQNSILKIILNKPRLYNSTLLYKDANVFNIKNTYAYHSLLWTFKSNNIYSSQNYSTHTYLTRSVQNKHIAVPMYKKTHTQRFIFYYGPKLYNVLPLSLKNITKINRYKKEIKKFISENQEIIDNILNI